MSKVMHKMAVSFLFGIGFLCHGGFDCRIRQSPKKKPRLSGVLLAGILP